MQPGKTASEQKNFLFTQSLREENFAREEIWHNLKPDLIGRNCREMKMSRSREFYFS